MIGVLIVDDQELVRAGLRHILGNEQGIVVLGEAADGVAALEKVAELDPDVVLMDIRMRGMDGIDATRRIRDDNGPPVLVLTTFDTDDALWGAIEAGAAGFILKEASPEDLIRAVRVTGEGGAWLDQIVVPRVLAGARAGRPPSQPPGPSPLTPRELEVLALMAEAATNSEIAGTLHVSNATVKSHVGSIFSKLAVRDRAGAIVYAYRHNLVLRQGGASNLSTRHPRD